MKQLQWGLSGPCAPQLYRRGSMFQELRVLAARPADPPFSFSGRVGRVHSEPLRLRNSALPCLGSCAVGLGSFVVSIARHSSRPPAASLAPAILLSHRLEALPTVRPEHHSGSGRGGSILCETDRPADREPSVSEIKSRTVEAALAQLLQEPLRSLKEASGGEADAVTRRRSP